MALLLWRGEAGVIQRHAMSSKKLIDLIVFCVVGTLFDICLSCVTNKKENKRFFLMVMQLASRKKGSKKKKFAGFLTISHVHPPPTGGLK